MPNYSKGIIYTIRSKDNVYVGSTIDFRSRKYSHKSNMYNENGKEYNFNIYKTIRANECEWDMQPYSIFPCNSKIELTIEEERIRRLLKADMNTRMCGSECSTKKQYYKQYNDQHKDEIKKYKKQYYEEHKDEKKEYDKQYHKEHKDELNKKHKQYHKEHKDELNKKKKQKVTCECGCIVAKGYLSQHRKTKKHINFMEKLNH
jgi:hypothetical protein